MPEFPSRKPARARYMKNYVAPLRACVKCGQVKPCRARGACNRCYVHFQRNGILHRLGSLRDQLHWKESDLVKLCELRSQGKTVRECCPHFPTRSYFAVRLACVSRGFIRSTRVTFAEIAAETAKTLESAKKRNPKRMPKWWARETRLSDQRGPK